MNEGIGYADIVIMALVAGFVLLRLRGVLGQHSEDDTTRLKRPPQTPVEVQEDEPARVMPLAASLDKALRKKEQAPREAALDPLYVQMEEGAVKEALAQVKQKDPQFSATAFVQGAKVAYEMVFDAFAKKDKKTLNMLLAPEVYAEFEQALSGADAGEVTLVSVRAKAIESAALTGSKARLSVSFDSEQMHKATSAVTQSRDEWVFERDVSSKNPNWVIVET